MGHMGAAMGHACAHTWPYMRAYMGHTGAAMGYACAHTWAIYRGIYGPYGSSNRACMRAYMAIYGSSPIGRVGRKGIIGNLFPSLIIFTPSLPLPFLLEGKGVKIIPFSFLLYSVA